MNNRIYDLHKKKLLLGINLNFLQDRINTYIKHVLKEAFITAICEKKYNVINIHNILTNKWRLGYIGKDKTNTYYVIPKALIKDLCLGVK